MPHSTKTDHLSALEREKLIKPYLPVPRIQEPSPSAPIRRKHKKRVRPFVKNKLHVLLYFLIQLVFGIYIRLRQVYHSIFDRILAILYYHHRTPDLIRKDVGTLSRLPEHLSVILTLRLDEDGALETLMDEVAELSAWCSSAGIPLLSVYEKTGVLKNYMPALKELVGQKLASYFGAPPTCPSLRVFAPNHTGSSRSPSPNPMSKLERIAPALDTQRRHLNLLLLSASDGRDTLVDLTRTLTEMSQSQKLLPKDITVDLIDAEISATTSIPSTKTTSATPTAEPDLLIVFGPSVKLQGYPPWQVRLTEIFCVGDSSADVSGYGKGRSGNAARVEYQAFLRGLWRFAGAEMRFGR
jgi:dehydrodolichyl diphosphate syntase complex subunit NUS1